MTYAQRIGRIFEYRAILWTLVKRDLRIRYSRSVLGYLWTLIDPLAMTLIYWFVFGVIYQIGTGKNPLERSDGIPFVLFLVAGVLAWNWFNNSVNESARALYSERLLVRSTNLPRELWVIRVVLSKGIEHLMALPILVMFMALFAIRGDITLNAKLLLWIPALLLQLILCIGVGLVMAPVTTLVDDFVRIVRIGLRMGFYLTPIVYSLNFVQARAEGNPAEGKAPEPLLGVVARVLEFNPLSAINDMYRQGMLPNGTPEYRIWAIGIAISLFWLIFGMWVFARLEKPILKEI